jgi:hypothetical protein
VIGVSRGDDVFLAEEELIRVVALTDLGRHVVIGLNEQVPSGVPGEGLDAVGVQRPTLLR